jgi:glutamate--cysteine ligase
MTTPTSDIDETSPRIAGKHELVEYLEAGCKPAEDWRIGTEHEKFGFLRENLAPLPYEGKASVLAMLEGLRDRFGWDPIVESGKADRPAARWRQRFAGAGRAVRACPAPL